MPPAAIDATSTSETPASAMSGLTQRVVTGSILAASMVAAILMLPSDYFALLIAAFVLLGAWEWAGLAGWPAPAARLGCAVGMLPLLLGAALMMQVESGLLALLLAGLVWWLTALAWVVQIQQGLAVSALDSPLVRVGAGVLVLVPAWAAVVALHASSESGPYMLLYLTFLISSADSAAYFVGRRLGKRRLASIVSPGKSLEGVAGALTAVAMLAIAVALFADVASPAGFVALSLITALVSILGDLTESAFKRRAGLKDSGSIIPGHGGILDRIDSVSSAAPVFVLGCLVLGGTF